MPIVYYEIAEHLDIDVKELKRRLCGGEPLVHLYYKWKYGWENDEQVPF